MGDIESLTLLLRSQHPYLNHLVLGVHASASPPSWLPIHWACQSGVLQQVQLLVTKGADVHSRTLYKLPSSITPLSQELQGMEVGLGETPLSIAENCGHEDIAMWLKGRLQEEQEGQSDYEFVA